MKHDLFKYNIITTESGIREVEGLPKGDYDVQAVRYDRLISNGLYNRIMWGNTPADYSAFCQQGLKKHTDGVIADIGCGTLGFTYKVYGSHCGRELYLCDLSREMLKIGKIRLEKRCKDLPGITFLRADALDMPFRDGTVQTLMSFGLLHIFDDPSRLLQEFVRILQPGRKLFLTSLCTDRKISAKYLKLLHEKGHVARPMHSVEIREIVEKNGIQITDFRVKGGMVYISGKATY